MKYKVIFTAGYDDDIDSIVKELKCDVLILNEEGNLKKVKYVIWRII